MKAYFLGLIDQSDANTPGREQRRYRMDPPYCGSEHIMASAVTMPFSGPEVYLFATDADGEVTDWGELHGSQRGTSDIDSVMADVGYEVGDMTSAADAQAAVDALRLARRDEFTKAALQGLVARMGGNQAVAWMAKEAVALADATIARLDAPQ